MAIKTIDKTYFKTSLLNFSIWLLWDFSGCRFAWEKIRPPSKQTPPERPPSTFILWVVGIYVAFFGVASARYENKIDIIENRANLIFSQLSVPGIGRKALNRIPSVQNMPCPSKPILLKPSSVFRSLFKEGKYETMVELLKETAEDWRSDLSQLSLSDANLQGASLSNANLFNTNLTGANLEGADLSNANLEKAIIVGANLRNANLFGANLQGAVLLMAQLQRSVLQNTNLQGSALNIANFQEANLIGADLQRAMFNHANLQGAILVGANVQEASFSGVNLIKAKFRKADIEDKKNFLVPSAKMKSKLTIKEAFVLPDLKQYKDLTIDMLCKVHTFYEAELDQQLRDSIKKRCPRVLKKPD